MLNPRLFENARGRPLNVARAKGEIVQVVLEDVNGAWSTGALELSIELGS